MAICSHAIFISNNLSSQSDFLQQEYYVFVTWVHKDAENIWVNNVGLNWRLELRGSGVYLLFVWVSCQLSGSIFMRSDWFDFKSWKTEQLSTKCRLIRKLATLWCCFDFPPLSRSSAWLASSLKITVFLEKKNCNYKIEFRTLYMRAMKINEIKCQSIFFVLIFLAQKLILIATQWQRHHDR